MEGRERKLIQNAEHAHRARLSSRAFQELKSEKLKEIVQLQASLLHAVQQLPAGAERENALHELIGFQSRMTALIRRRWQA